MNLKIHEAGFASALPESSTLKIEKPKIKSHYNFEMNLKIHGAGFAGALPESSALKIEKPKIKSQASLVLF